MTMRESALALARAGEPVIVLHGIDSTGFCVPRDSREHLAAKACKPGKHPWGEYSVGAKSATTDPAVIATWPEDGYNLGVVSSETRVAIDIDDPTLATNLLRSGLLDDHVVVLTGREGGGLHLHLNTVPSRSANLKSTTGAHLGEVRCQNMYVVVPPSRHQSGRNYRYAGKRTLLNGGRQTLTTTANEFIEGLLRRFDVALAPPAAAFDEVEVEGLRGRIMPLPKMPFAVPTNAMALRQYLSGTYPVSDRSGFAFKLACEVYRVAAQVGVEVDHATVAGIVKHVDSLPGYRKFANRVDGDRQIWTCVYRAANDPKLRKQIEVLSALRGTRYSDQQEFDNGG